MSDRCEKRKAPVGRGRGGGWMNIFSERTPRFNIFGDCWMNIFSERTPRFNIFGDGWSRVSRALATQCDRRSRFVLFLCFYRPGRSFQRPNYLSHTVISRRRSKKASRQSRRELDWGVPRRRTFSSFVVSLDARYNTGSVSVEFKRRRSCPACRRPGGARSSTRTCPRRRTCW